MRRWYHEPLLHFLLAGVILFSAFALFRGDNAENDARTIVVDRRALLTFLQYRANAFDPDTFGTALEGMTDDELDDVINAYVDEEILYREAKELGLEESDNNIRQRMVQKMDFLLADMATESTSISDADLEAYFRENIELYAVAPWATFTHVFFDAQKRGEEGAREAAEAAKQELNRRGAGFNDTAGLGDNFPYLRNYVERTFEYIASHFGYDFVASLQALDPSDNEWQGPFHSVFGWHVILLTERADRAYPRLDDVRGRVERDLAAERSDEAVKKMTRAMRDRYKIRIEDVREEPGP
jgi:PPIC-type PPIASE domain